MAVGVGVAAGAAGTAAFAMANKTTQGFDKISKNSAKLGVTTDTYQEMSYWASQNGISSADMEKAIGRLNQRIGLAVNGNTAYAEGLEKMGVSMDDVRDGTVSTEDAMYTMIQSLSQMDNEQEKAAVASEVFGVKLARELMPALQDGSMTIDEARDAAERLGLVIGEETIDAGVKFQDNLTDIKASLSAVGSKVMGDFIPVFNTMMDLFLENMPLIQDVFGKVVNAIFPLVEQVLPILVDLAMYFVEEILPILLDLINQLLADALPVLIDLFMFVIESILPILNQLLEVVVQDILPILITLFTEVISQVLPPLMELLEVIINELLPVFIDLFTDILAAVLPALIDIILALLPVVTDLILLLTDIVQVVVPPLIEIIEFLADIITTVLQNSFEDLMPIIENIIDIFNNLIDFIKNIFTGNWSDAWDNVVEIFKNIFEGIVNIAKLPLNTMIGLINGFIKGLNKIKIPDWVPGVGGKGINIPEIPKLKEGGTITTAGAAIVGEAGAELLELPRGARVTPLNNNNKGLATEVNNNFNIANLTVREEADIKKIARELYKLQNNRRGGVAFA